MFGNDLSIIVALAAQFGNQIDQKALYDFTTGIEVYTVPNEAIQYFLEDFIKNNKLTGNYILSGCFTNITESRGSFVIENSVLERNFIFLYQKFSTSLMIHPFENSNSKWTMSMPIQVINQGGELIIKILDEFLTTPDGRGNQHSVIKTPELESLAHIYLLLFCFISNQCYAATP